MDAGRYPSFAGMYADYFHEDWRLEDASADDVVRRNRRFAPPDEVDHLTDELTGLLASHPSEDALRAELIRSPITTLLRTGRPFRRGLSTC